jgi:hypothetical protein
MLCDHQLVIEHINDYVDNKVSPVLRHQIEEALGQCSDCQSTYHQCIEMVQLSQTWQQESTPEWHRTRFAVRPPAKHNNWLSWGSMATSSLAILMVVFQLEINSTEAGINISFGGNQAESKIEQMVSSQLETYKSEQDKLFQVKLDNALEKQDNKTKLRLATWLEKNRDERQQDIKFVMTGWQSQRYQDQQNADKRFAYIADNQIENNQAINQLFQTVESNPKENKLSNQPNNL